MWGAGHIGLHHRNLKKKAPYHDAMTHLVDLPNILGHSDATDYPIWSGGSLEGWNFQSLAIIFMGEFLFFCRSYTLHPSRNMNMLCACESKILEEIFMYDGVSRWNQGSRFEWLELRKVCIQIQSS